MRLIHILRSLVAAVIPPCAAKNSILRLLGWKIGRKCRIGLSWISSARVALQDGAHIGHGNFIRCEAIMLRDNAYIGHLNRVTGPIWILLCSHAGIGNQNTIVRGKHGISWGRAKLRLGQWSKLTVQHVVDCTRSIVIGDYSIIAGRGSQLWTHGYIHAPSGIDRTRIDGSISIGHNVYIGSSCIINAGVAIGNSITIGAGSSVPRSISQPGLYVSQPLRHIEYDYQEAINRHPSIEVYGLVERVIYKKISS